MKIALIGRGMLGSAVLSHPAFKSHEVIVADRNEGTDICSEDSLASWLDQSPGIDLIINAAALSHVDRCEEEPKLARSVNALGVKNLCLQAKRIKAALIHISTDYVFDGLSDSAYKESDATGPVSIYGQTKLEGEFYPRFYDLDYAVVRTTWLFGGERTDFVNGITAKITQGENLSVVDDQTANPTYVKDLSGALALVAEKINEARQKGGRFQKTLHITNQGKTTRKKMTEVMAVLAGADIKVTPLTQHDIKNWLAVRPKNSSLDISLFENEFGMKMRPWQDALKEYVLAKVQN